MEVEDESLEQRIDRYYQKEVDHHPDPHDTWWDEKAPTGVTHREEHAIRFQEKESSKAVSFIYGISEEDWANSAEMASGIEREDADSQATQELTSEPSGSTRQLEKENQRKQPHPRRFDGLVKNTAIGKAMRSLRRSRKNLWKQQLAVKDVHRWKETLSLLCCKDCSSIIRLLPDCDNSTYYVKVKSCWYCNNWLGLKDELLRECRDANVSGKLINEI
jgi:hypothetical protein